MRFEQSILDFADAYNINKSRQVSRTNSFSIASGANTPSSSVSGSSTPALSRGVSGSSSRADSFVLPPSSRPAIGSFGAEAARRPSFASRLQNMLAMSTLHENRDDSALCDLPEVDEKKDVVQDIEAAWEIECDGVDRSVHILPGVREMIDSLPEGRYAVATSGAKTYGM